MPDDADPPTAAPPPHVRRRTYQRYCPIDEAARDRLHLIPRDYLYWQPYRPEESLILLPDDPADEIASQARLVGCFRHPCAAPMREQIGTIWAVDPGPRVVALPYRLASLGVTVWLVLEPC